MTLDVNSLIKERKYGIKVGVYGIFLLFWLLFLFLVLISFEQGDQIDSILFELCIIFVAICWGICGGIKTMIELNNIKNGNFTIVEMKLYKKHYNTHSDNNRSIALIFGGVKVSSYGVSYEITNNVNVCVSFVEAEEYNEGDICYRVRIQNANGKQKFIGRPYNKRFYVLGDDVKDCLDRTFVQESVDPRCFDN